MEVFLPQNQAGHNSDIITHKIELMSWVCIHKQFIGDFSLNLQDYSKHYLKVTQNVWK